MINKELITALLFMVSIVVLSQSNSTKPLSDKDFNEIYDEYYAYSLVNQNLTIKRADSLFNISQSNTHKFKSLVLKARAYAIMGQGAESLEYSKEALEWAKKTDDYYWQASISSSIVRPLTMGNLFEEARKYQNDVWRLTKLIKEEYNQMLALQSYYEEEALLQWSITDKGAREAIVPFLKANNLLKNYKGEFPHRYYMLAQNEYYLAEAYMEIEDRDSAHYYYQAAFNSQKKVENFDERFLSAIKLGLERTSPDRNKDSLIETAKNAISISKKTNNHFISGIAYESLLEEDLTSEEAKEYLLQGLIQNKEDFNQKAEVNSGYLKNTQKEKEKISSFMKILGIVSIILIIMLIYMYVRYKKRRKEDKIKFNTLLKKFEEQKELQNSLPEEINPETSIPELETIDEALETEGKNEIKQDLGINSHTEIKILNKLNKFENKEGYTNKNISLSYLAAEFNTNSRYLSYVVNTHRNSDFKSYINTLRVNFVINKLISDEKYRKYKISTLAEESGFSSHSKFATIFKSITGISPSTFIEFLEEDNQEKLKKYSYN